MIVWKSRYFKLIFHLCQRKFSGKFIIFSELINIALFFYYTVLLFFFLLTCFHPTILALSDFVIKNKIKNDIFGVATINKVDKR